MTRLRTSIFVVLIVSAVIGLAASVESVLSHYAITSSDFCRISETFDCDVVNKSEYSVLFGIPVSIFGVLTYLAFLVGAILYRKHHNKRVLDMMVALSVVGVTFSLYLTFIEAFVLYTWCLVCLTSFAAIIATTICWFIVRNNKA